MRRLRWVGLLALAAAACDNAGGDRTLGITATGVVYGSVYFDANGSRTADADDIPFVGARVRLLTPVARDTVLRAVTDAAGRFRLAGVPVGAYAVVIDTASVGDTAIVVPGGTSLLSVAPGDSAAFIGSVSFPIRTIAQARALPPGGGRFFVAAVALNARLTFSDTTLHLVDASGAIRAVRVRPSAAAVAPGDSVMVRTRVGTRNGQAVLDDATTFIIAPTFIPPAATVTTVVASMAAGGTRDAQLVRLVDVAITDTATVAGNLTLTFNDGSGPVVVVLDRAADLAFRGPFPPGEYQSPNRFDVTGLLVPTGAGAWRLKPRSVLDLVRR